MARGGVIVGVIALLGLGGYVALPDDEPGYLGDMPSIIEQAEAAPPLPTRLVPPPPAPPPLPVEGPSPVVAEAPPPIPPAPGERVPAPITDAPADFAPNSGDRGAGGPGTGLLDLLDELPDGLIPCVDTTTVFRPGLGTVDCVTGLLVLPDPDLPVDPCSVAPLPIECPVLPDPLG
jgi:hypothetical protein